MLELIRKTWIGCAVLLAVALTAAASPSQAAVGSVRIHLAKAGFIFGASGGSGVLRFHGRAYPLSIGGISVGTIGVAGADLVGRAYRLRRAGDIVGTYTAVSGSVAIVAGAKAIRLMNANGVVLELQGPEVGLEASASLSGMGISLPQKSQGEGISATGAGWENARQIQMADSKYTAIKTKGMTWNGAWDSNHIWNII